MKDDNKKSTAPLGTDSKFFHHRAFANPKATAGAVCAFRN
jgi:hypothetical protein